MSNTEQIKEALKKLILKDDKEFVAMLSGEWGIGKTYFWKKFTKEYLKDKSVVYISLFGKNSLADIETDIITKLYKYNKSLKKYTRHLDTVGNMASKAMGLPINVSIGSLLSLFTPNDFKNVVICFDDFERLSDKVSLKDVMGLISQFKEQKKCKVIMILNERELDKLSDIDGKKHSEIFALYKEKIIDYSFHYQPIQEEQSEAISEDKDIKEIKFCEHQTIYDFFKKIELKNIRIMKQSLYLLKQFSFIGAKGYDKKVIDEFVEIALNLFVFKAKCNYTYDYFMDFRKYKPEIKYTMEYDGKTDTLSQINIDTLEDNYHDKCRNSYHKLPFKSSFEDIEKIVYRYLDSHIINKDELLAILRESNSSLDNSTIQDQIFTLYNKACFDFLSSLSQCAEEIFNLLENHKNEIPYIFEPIVLERYLNFIEEHNNAILSQNFRDTLIKLYIDFKPNGERHRFTLIGYKNFIGSFYPHLISYLNDAIVEETREQVNINDIQAKLEKFSSHSSHNNQDIEFLNSLPSSIYKQHIRESSEFYNEITDFLSAGTPAELTQTNSNIKKALLELREDNTANAWRINQFTNETNINLEEDK